MPDFDSPIIRRSAEADEVTIERSAPLLRDEIFDLINAVGAEWPGSPIKTIRKISQPPLQPTDLPSVSIFTTDEDETPFGQFNVNIPLAFHDHVTIGISVCRGFADPIYLLGGLETDVLFIKHLLLTDKTFLARRWHDELTEGVERMRVRPVFDQQQGETYFGEMRLEMAFRFPEVFVPIVTDRFRELSIKLRNRIKRYVPPFRGEIDLPQQRRDRGHDGD